MSLNILLDADVSKLRDSIRQGLQTGQWDMKVGEMVFVHGSPLTVNSQHLTIEFSDRMVLYRRGILQPPKPREIELNAQVMSSTDSLKPVRVRWKAAGALTIKLYQDGNKVQDLQYNQPRVVSEGTSHVGLVGEKFCDL